MAPLAITQVASRLANPMGHLKRNQRKETLANWNSKINV